jgi:hypothetical protein
MHAITSRGDIAMAPAQLDDELKQAIKAAVAEVFDEKAGILREIIEETLEDIALGKAMDEVADAPEVSREEVMAVLEGRA